MVADCWVRDKVVDRYTTRIEWWGPGKNGKDNVYDQGAAAHWTYTFGSVGKFGFKVVEDKGALPDAVGRTVTLYG